MCVCECLDFTPLLTCSSPILNRPVTFLFLLSSPSSFPFLTHPCSSHQVYAANLNQQRAILQEFFFPWDYQERLATPEPELVRRWW